MKQRATYKRPWPRLASSGCFRISFAIDVRPHKPDNPRDECNLDGEVKTMECLIEPVIGVPLLAELHAYVGKAEASWPRTGKGINVEAELRHLRNTCGK